MLAVLAQNTIFGSQVSCESVDLGPRSLLHLIPVTCYFAVSIRDRGLRGLGSQVDEAQ